MYTKKVEEKLKELKLIAEIEAKRNNLNKDTKDYLKQRTKAILNPPTPSRKPDYLINEGVFPPMEHGDTTTIWLLLEATSEQDAVRKAEKLVNLEGSGPVLPGAKFHQAAQLKKVAKNRYLVTKNYGYNV